MIALAALLVSAGTVVAASGQSNSTFSIGDNDTPTVPADDHANKTADERPGEHASNGQHSEHANERAENASEQTDERNENATEKANESANADEKGPRTDLPTAIPDHVRDRVQTIHIRITEFIDGSLDDPLGAVISDLNEDAGADAEATAGANATATVNDSATTHANGNATVSATIGIDA